MVTWYWSADNLFWRVSIYHSAGCPISKKYTVNQGCMSMSTYLLDYGRHVAWLRRRRRAYAPTSNTASHDNHKKILHGFPFLSRDDYGAPLGGPLGRRSSAISKLMIAVDIFITRKQRKNFSFTLSIFSVIATNSTSIEQQSCNSGTNSPMPGH